MKRRRDRERCQAVVYRRRVGQKRRKGRCRFYVADGRESCQLHSEEGRRRRSQLIEERWGRREAYDAVAYDSEKAERKIIQAARLWAFGRLGVPGDLRAQALLEAVQKLQRLEDSLKEIPKCSR